MDAATSLLAGCELSGPAELRPHRSSLFVAWNGVLCLVYDGFPPALVAIKQQLCTLNIAPEKFGSKWPKTTLAAQVDDTLMTLAQLQTLQQLCRQHSEAIAQLDACVPVPIVSVVDYECRGLEKLRQRTDLELSGDALGRRASPDELARVEGVLSEWSDLEGYLSKVNAPGSRIATYREDSPQGCTCVGFLQPMPEALSAELASFRQAVDAALPGRYTWLESASLHCTLRALD